MDDLNNFQIKLKVTLEPKSEIQINYLDITVIREKNTIETKIFWKNMNSETILDYNSVHHIK